MSVFYSGFSYEEVVKCPAYKEGYDLGYDLAFADAECPACEYKEGTLEAFAFKFGFSDGLDREYASLL